jgi:glycosyltransferase involved in cell wall biosynthesis
MYLEKSGFESTISIVGDSQFVSGKDAQESIRKHFFPINAEVIIGTSELKPANATFATSWITAYYARNLKQAGYKLYFVQDYEPYFYAHGSEYYFAEDTYRMGFHGVTAGNWLADKLSHEFSMKTTPMGFSYDHDLYYPHVRRDKIQKRVFFYSRPVTLRRGFELGILALDIVAKKYPDVDFILAGWDCSNYFIPFRHLNAGNVPVANLPDLYSQCDVALVLSLTNLSLLPLEIMACGCPVVSNKGSSVEWLLNDENALLVDLTVISLSNAIITLLEDEEMRSDLSMRGRKFASKTSWEVEAKKVVDLLNSIVIDGIT